MVRYKSSPTIMRLSGELQRESEREREREKERSAEKMSTLCLFNLPEPLCKSLFKQSSHLLRNCNLLFAFYIGTKFIAYINFVNLVPELHQVKQPTNA